MAVKVLNNGLTVSQVVNCVECTFKELGDGKVDVTFKDNSSVEFDKLYDEASLYDATTDTYSRYTLDRELERWFRC